MLLTPWLTQKNLNVTPTSSDSQPFELGLNRFLHHRPHAALLTLLPDALAAATASLRPCTSRKSRIISLLCIRRQDQGRTMHYTLACECHALYFGL